MLATSFKDLIHSLLPANQQEAYFTACQKPLKKSLTINPTKISTEEFETYASEQGWILEKHPFLQESYSYYIDRPDTSIALGNHWMHQCGFFYIQEIAASTPAYLLNLPENALVLDIAASPGGKTSQLSSQLLRNKQSDFPHSLMEREGLGGVKKPGLVIANDIDTLRIRTLSENLQRMNARNTATSKLDGTKRGDRCPETFDSILVDAPCSGEGTGFKSDDALTHWRIEEIRKIAGLQEQILRSAIHACKVGGEILYSTCTLNTLENEGVLANILQEFKDSITLENISTINTESGYELDNFTSEQTQKVARFWPHLQKTGGFFVSKLKKSAPTSSAKKIGKPNFYGKINTPEIKLIKSLLKEFYGIKLDPVRFLLFIQGETCYLTSPKILEFPYADISTGIPLGKLVRNNRIPTHFLGSCLGHLATKNIIEIDSTQAQEYVENKNLDVGNLRCEVGEHPFYLLRRQGQGIGTVKWVQGDLKSKFEM